jgi:dihydroneopterin triphosphate diphosphatase
VPRAPFQVLVLPYRRRAEIEVAVFRRADYDLWQFVSGGGELGETPEAAARREGFEEAGLARDATYLRLDSMTTIPACWFAAWSTWGDDLLVVPEHAFGVEVQEHPIRLSTEHLEFAWLEYGEAMERLRFDSNRNALWELAERLSPGPRCKRPAYR